jgi:signal transduction histidine kinase
MNTNTTRLARLASIGLGAVLLVLAVFAVTTTILTDRAVERASDRTALSVAYERARFAVGEEESLERKYRLEPGPEIRVKYQRAVDEVLAAMSEVARTGGKDDAEVARHVLRVHTPYLAAIGRMFDAVDRHDTRVVLRIDANEVDPTFADIETSVSDAAARQRQASAAALHDSASISRHVVWLAPGVFTAGLGLLGLIWILRRREQSAAASKLARRNELLADQANRLHETLEERKLAESALAETQERLRHTQRLETVGELAGGVAHDFNNLLQVILGYCGLLEAAGSEENRHEVAEIGTAAARGAELTRQLLAFGRRQTLTPAVWDVNAVVANVDSMLRRILPSQIDFQALLSEKELCARVDCGQLEQVLVNLVLNARDAMPDGGTLTIFTEPFELDRPLVVEDVELPQGSYVRIAVRDIGSGMDEETKARAFEPFFTTKERGRGTGLGLSTVYGIVRQSGGFVSLDSTLGVGTEVAVCLPRTLESAALSAAPDAEAPSKAQSAMQVLLVEDDTAVRSVLARYLRSQGFSVLEAADGLEGVELFREHGTKIDVVVTDISMPNLDGWGLVNELRNAGDGIPIVVMSGFAGEAQREDDARLERLSKPFAPVEVARAIARLTPLARH